ncbi:MAG: Primosomal protein N' [Chloroflexi bacterium]|nr:Primosomal protein N' [Chloroflexota bacterium]
MPNFVEIAVNVPHVRDVYHYSVPARLREKITPGHLVTAPFGRQTVQGIVLQAIQQPQVPQTKDILNILDPQPVVTPTQIELARHLAETTLTPLGICVHAMLPSGLSKKADSLYKFTKRSQERLEAGEEVYSTLTPAQERLVDLLAERGPLRGRQIQHALPRKRWRATARALERRGVIESQAVLQAPSVRPKSVRFVELTCSPEEAQEQMETLAQAGYPDALERRQAILRLLLENPDPLPVSHIYRETGGNLADLRQLAKRDLLRITEETVLRDPLEDLTPPPPQQLTLTKAQQEVWNIIRQALEKSPGSPRHLVQRDGDFQGQKPFLLYGVTGSGKTEIYLQAVKKVQEQGRQALILVPEIALTPQTVRRFLRRFPGEVGVIHSQLSAGERYDTWRMAREGEISVVVGPRSALFTPFPQVGLIVVDECHDESYYQSENPPLYHAQEAAMAYARLSGGACILGSATPNVTSTYRAAQGEMEALSLPERILAHRDTVKAQVAGTGQTPPSPRYQPLDDHLQMAELPPVEVVDMRRELKSGNRSIFSRSLQEALGQVLAREQQAILFLNRRGTSTYVFCRDCGQALECPRCDTSLTYHRWDSTLRCHRCGYERKMPTRCPACGSSHIKQYGTGTEQVERKLKALHPGIRTLRWDRDTTRQKGAHEQIMEKFSAHEADVLIGTQMLAKGLDLPLVTLVGIVLADMGLNFPDYRTNERTFQILTQVAGRAGRSPLGGDVILQTFQPEHFVMQAAAGHNYRAFYGQEIAHRRELGYPPFSKLVRLETRSPRVKEVEERAKKLAKKIRGWIEDEGYRGTEIIGPVPCFFGRVRGEYRWHIILRGPNPEEMLRGRMTGSEPPFGGATRWKVEVEPVSLL